MILHPLISVLLPIYKFDEYVLIAINSILDQTYSNFELIIIDDSHDDILKNAIIDFDDIRIKHIKGNNNGISSALNIGINISSGAYIARMDADDISVNNRFEEQYKYLVTNNLDLCGSNIQVFGSVEQNMIVPELDSDIKFYLLIGCPIAHPTLFAKSEVLKEYKYNEAIFAGEDYDLWSRMAFGGIKFGNIQKFLLKYRTHTNQATKTNTKQFENILRIANEYSKKYLLEQEYSKFSILNFGLSTHYSTLDVQEISFFLKNIIDFKKINPKIVKRYINSLQIRISDISFISIKSYFRIINIYNYKINLIILFYLIVNSYIPVKPQQKRFSLFRKLF
jgi:glycosyltransferase involved in cell wall biosynthesis